MDRADKRTASLIPKRFTCETTTGKNKKMQRSNLHLPKPDVKDAEFPGGANW